MVKLDLGILEDWARCLGQNFLLLTPPGIAKIIPTSGIIELKDLGVKKG